MDRSVKTGELLHGAVALSSTASRYMPGVPVRFTVVFRQQIDQLIVQSSQAVRFTTVWN